MRIAGGPRSRQPRIVVTIPATISGGRSRSESARQPIPTAISTAAAIAAWRAGLRPRRSPGQREHDREAGDRSRRPPGGGGGGEDREQRGHRDQPPRNAEPVDAMVDRGLERRGDDDPERRARRSFRRPPRSCRRARRWSGARVEGACGWRRLRRACRAGAAAAARRPRSRRRRPARPAAGTRSPRRTSPAPPPAGRSPAPRSPRRPICRVASRNEGVDRRRSLAFTSTVTCSGAPADDGETSANSSLSLRGFSTMPTTVRRPPSSASVEPELEPQQLGDAVGDRDLAGARRGSCHCAARAARRRRDRADPARGSPRSRRPPGQRSSGGR